MTVARPARALGGVLAGVGRGLALVHSALQVPSPELVVADGVEQLPTTCPPLVVNATAVPSGAGLL